MSELLHRPQGMKIYGLTGGIASGKTSVAKFFAEFGIPVIDADELARGLRAPGGPAYDLILQEFGTVDARELRGLIFSDPSKKARLEAILHPLIQAESERRFQALSQTSAAEPPRYCLYEAALLVETGRHESLDGLIVVHSDPENQLRRLMQRDGVDEAGARQTLVAQGDTSVKRRAATHLIVNDGTLEELRAKVGEIHALLGH